MKAEALGPCGAHGCICRGGKGVTSIAGWLVCDGCSHTSLSHYRIVISTQHQGRS